MTFSTADYSFMAQALKLAERGRFTARPNPMVGCVLVKDKKIIGSGWHQQAGQPHAEVNALADAAKAGKDVSGATAYVTLEPCSHQGRTGPCADALIKANVAKVIIAMQDPFIEVSGKGITRLQNAGITVEVGCLEKAATSLNRHFLYRATQHRPWVTVKLGMSLDGKIALANGQSQWITSNEARRDVQAYRAQYDAILTGADTVLTDNPSMNVRSAELPLHVVETLVQQEAHVHLQQPACFIVDSKQRLGSQATIMRSTTTVFGVQENLNSLYGNVNYQLVSRSISGQCDLGNVLDHIARTPANAVWVEAGPQLVGALLDANLVNELIIYQAPIILGASAQSAFGISTLESLTRSIKLSTQSVTTVGTDIKHVLLVQKDRKN